jgi:hypothetical protein
VRDGALHLHRPDAQAFSVGHATARIHKRDIQVDPNRRVNRSCDASGRLPFGASVWVPPGTAEHPLTVSRAEFG